jgi:phosphoglycerate dehydrogenase-like enzyme
MPGLLMTRRFAREYGERVAATAGAAGLALEPVVIAALKSPRLRWLHLSGTGVDHPVFQTFLDRDVVLSNSPGVNAVPIAQTAFAGLLMLARGFPRWLAAQAERRWAAAPRPLPVDLADQTLVVVGLGRIGGELARLGRAAGLRVVGVRRRAGTGDEPVDALVPPEALDTVLPAADWLALACPLTSRTRGLLDARRLGLLPSAARVLNVARGEVVDEGALIAALTAGRLGGAYLDVFQAEPLPEDSPLWTLPNVIVTPHASSVSAGAWGREAERFFANLERFVRGEPLENRVTSRDL